MDPPNTYNTITCGFQQQNDHFCSCYHSSAGDQYDFSMDYKDANKVFIVSEIIKDLKMLVYKVHHKSITFKNGQMKA